VATRNNPPPLAPATHLVPHHHVVLGVAQHCSQVVNGQRLLHLAQHVGNLVAEEGRAARVAQGAAQHGGIGRAVLVAGLGAQEEDGAHARSNGALRVEQRGHQLLAGGCDKGHGGVKGELGRGLGQGREFSVV
jgi:hypothetical protein